MLDGRIVEFLRDKNVPIYTREIYLNSKGLSHLSRDSKKKRGAGLNEQDIVKIPDILKSPSAVYFDEAKGKLNVLYCSHAGGTCAKMIKLVIDTKYRRKKEAFSILKTAGYVEEANLKSYAEIFGDVESR